MRILLVEDEYMEETFARSLLTAWPFKIPDSEIETITTEEEFYQKAESIARSPKPPELVIMDVMIRWTDPKPGELDLEKVPAAVKKDGPYRAGLRCAELLDSLNPNIPILFYTILDREVLDSDLFLRRGPVRTIDYAQKADPARKPKDKAGILDYAQKDDDEDPLFDKLRYFLGGDQA